MIIWTVNSGEVRNTSWPNYEICQMMMFIIFTFTYLLQCLRISLVFIHANLLWLNTSSPSSSGRSELIRWSKVYYNGAVIAVLRSVCRYMCRFVIPITLSLSIYIYRVLLIAHAYLLEGILIVKYIVELPYSIEHNNG